MIREEPDAGTIFDKANAAAKAAMQSVVELASRTSTPVIVFRNGQIERLSPGTLAVSRTNEDDLTQPESNKD